MAEQYPEDLVLRVARAFQNVDNRLHRNYPGAVAAINAVRRYDREHATPVVVTDEMVRAYAVAEDAFDGGFYEARRAGIAAALAQLPKSAQAPAEHNSTIRSSDGHSWALGMTVCDGQLKFYVNGEEHVPRRRLIDDEERAVKAEAANESAAEARASVVSAAGAAHAVLDKALVELYGQPLAERIGRLVESRDRWRKRAGDLEEQVVANTASLRESVGREERHEEWKRQARADLRSMADALGLSDFGAGEGASMWWSRRRWSMGEYKPELVLRVARVMHSSVLSRPFQEIDITHQNNYETAARAVLDDLQVYAGEVAPGLAQELEQAKAEVARLDRLCEAHETQIKGLEKKNKRLQALTTTLEERLETSGAELTMKIADLEAQRVGLIESNNALNEADDKSAVRAVLVAALEINPKHHTTEELAEYLAARCEALNRENNELTSEVERLSKSPATTRGNGLVQVVSMATLGALVDALDASVELARMPSPQRGATADAAISRVRQLVHAEVTNV